MAEPTLYGIKHSNRKSKDFWGKNKFNSSFPVALANYMRDSHIKALYIQIDKNLKPFVSEIDIGQVFNATNIDSNDLYFGFEQKFEPYQQFSYETIDGIDLVVKHIDGRFLRPLEVKLTVVPDNTTKNLSEEKWGSEIVIRSATTSYCALGMANQCQSELRNIRDIFEPKCKKVESWSNSYEMNAHMPKLIELINTFEKEYLSKQQPLILQPIWKTEGQSPILSEHAFDLFIWSDFAFTRLFLNSPTPDANKVQNPMSRQMRSTARLARFLYEISKSGKVSLNDIYRQMTFNYQTDKEFSVSGRITNNYMKCDRLKNPIVPKSALFNIILNGGEKCLMPERRFDQSIYFTMARE